MTRVNSRAGKQAIFDLLSSLASIQIDDIPLPKYRYPSGGSLYPVQTYVQFPGEFAGGIAPGSYYFDPAKVLLAKVSQGGCSLGSQAEDGNAVTIVLVAKHSAVQPIYGALAQPFGALEAGYMSQLLHTQARSVGVILEGPVFPDADGLKALSEDCALEPDSEVICVLHVRQIVEQSIARPAEAATLSLSLEDVQ